MLGKLIKYEFKATYKFMLLLYAVLLVISPFMGLSNKPDYHYENGVYYSSTDGRIDTSAAIDVFKTLITLLFVVMMVVVLSSVFFYSISRFRKNILGDGGYLYHTLPVKTHNHILTKSITAVVWSIVSCIVACAAFMLMFAVMYSDFGLFIEELERMIKSFVEYIGKNTVLFILQVLTAIVTLFMMYLQIYASMAVGYSSNTHRAIKSVGVFVIIMFVDSWISSLAESILKPFINYESRTMVYSSLYGTSYAAVDLAIKLVFSLAFTAALFFITRYFLKNKLNLQ